MQVVVVSIDCVLDRDTAVSISMRQEPFGWSSHADCIHAEVDRAIDNLVKSGKLFTVPRRDSMPMMMGRHFPEYGMDVKKSLYFLDTF